MKKNNSANFGLTKIEMIFPENKKF
jgi:hypothetical protein